MAIRNRVGVMTCALNESATVAFALEPWLNVADSVVFIDTGSTDGTWEMVHELFARPLRLGRLIAKRVACPNFEIARARQAALDLLRSRRIRFAVKVDADDVFYDEGAAELARQARAAPPRVTHLASSMFELYQWQAHGDEDWLEDLHARRPIFWEMSFVPSHRRVFRIDTGAHAAGNWCDEAAGKTPENIFVPGPECLLHTPGVAGAHYGWARPVHRKQRKIQAWCGKADADPRVESLHLGDDWRRPRRQFHAHPESIERLIDAVRDWHMSRTRAAA